MPHPDLITTAEELYIMEGLSFSQCAARCGMSLTQVKRWSAAADPPWPQQRQEYQRTRLQVRQGLVLAKARLLESLLEDEDPRKANAFVLLLRAERSMRDEFLHSCANLAQNNQKTSAQPIRSPHEAVIALEEAVSRRLQALLSGLSRVDLATVKDLAAAMALIERLKTRYGGMITKTEPGLSPEAATVIRQRILGLDATESATAMPVAQPVEASKPDEG